MYRLITLDATNTLFRVRGSVGYQYAKSAMDQLGYQLSAANIDKEFRKAYKMYWTKYPNFGAAHRITSKQWWEKVVRKTFDGNIHSEEIEAFSVHLYNHFATGDPWEVFPEVMHVLTQLKGEEVTLGVISNFDERLEQILDSLKLREFFSFILTSRKVDVCKPSPEIFRLALKMSGVHSKEALHVGDNLELDVLGASSAGFSSLLLNRQDSSHKHVLENFKVIPNLKALIK
ncbi:haloacid dehalogenase-like hydrolase domain-containing protein 3 [Nematostella vectensis]|uniref:haloacid dehalogenase-like hydrolase domain-containing protein 3 n=1 Tax=Nematostella vectensis TaxID=45351 RepID=UPI002076EEFC|nr:haloacid dehalogenase-like hydrolase domain-containing protein 3 [Nematostella vectensis]